MWYHKSIGRANIKAHTKEAVMELVLGRSPMSPRDFQAEGYRCALYFSGVEQAAIPIVRFVASGTTDPVVMPGFCFTGQVDVWCDGNPIFMRRAFISPVIFNHGASGTVGDMLLGTVVGSHGNFRFLGHDLEKARKVIVDLFAEAMIERTRLDLGETILFLGVPELRQVNEHLRERGFPEVNPSALWLHPR